MNVQINRVRRGEKVYEYCRLVKAYRRKDGKPALKVLANLGEQSPRMVANLKEAIKAGKQDRPVISLDESLAGIIDLLTGIEEFSPLLVDNITMAIRAGLEDESVTSTSDVASG